MRRSHFARVGSGRKVTKLARMLDDGAWHSTLELTLATWDCAVHSTIHELRCNGLIILCRPIGKKVYAYRFIAFPGGVIPETEVVA